MIVSKKQLKKAVELSRKFFGFKPRKLKVVELDFPETLVHIGGCPRVDYINDKWTGELVQYYHYFEKDCNVFAFPEPQENGDNVLMIRGKFKITKDGLIG